uniref:Uncharacterized protein n=1 Tax=Salix viminalis TaxID=40686 RepID=A0A6N2MGQ5_SALVM
MEKRRKRILNCFNSLIFLLEIDSARFDFLCCTEKGFCFLTRPSLDFFKQLERLSSNSSLKNGEEFEDLCEIKNLKICVR